MKVDASETGIDTVQGTPTNALVLSEHVRMAIKDYFSRLGGCDVTELHALVLSEVERPLIQTVLEHCGYNQTRSAQMLGMSRSTLRKKIAQYGLE